MAKYYLECSYCGHRWDKVAWSPSALKHDTCPKCSDKNLIVREVDQASKNCYGYDLEQEAEQKKKQEETEWKYGFSRRSD